MARATAPAGSASFQVDGDPVVVSSSGSPSYGLPKIAYGAGGGTVFDPGGDYLYLYYFDWDGPQGIHVARTCRDTCGAAGTWQKWNGTSFSEPGANSSFIGPSGSSQSVIPAGPGFFDAFSSVSFNTYLGAYLMASATESGIAFRVSADGINWGPRVVALEFAEAADTTLAQFYPTVLDATTGSRDITGRNIRLVFAWQANGAGQKVPHSSYSANVELVLQETPRSPRRMSGI